MEVIRAEELTMVPIIIAVEFIIKAFIRAIN